MNVLNYADSDGLERYAIEDEHMRTRFPCVVVSNIDALEKCSDSIHFEDFQSDDAYVMGQIVDAQHDPGARLWVTSLPDGSMVAFEKQAGRSDYDIPPKDIRNKMIADYNSWFNQEYEVDVKSYGLNSGSLQCPVSQVSFALLDADGMIPTFLRIALRTWYKMISFLSFRHWARLPVYVDDPFSMEAADQYARRIKQVKVWETFSAWKRKPPQNDALMFKRGQKICAMLSHMNSKKDRMAITADERLLSFQPYAAFVKEDIHESAEMFDVFVKELECETGGEIPVRCPDGAAKRLAGPVGWLAAALLPCGLYW